jgi:Leucine-rich repeat (LRR) protein
LPSFQQNQLDAQILWINDNKIASLPAGIKQLSNLRTLRLDDNEIQIIPSFLASCTRMENLSAKRNKIHQLSLDIFGLQFIKTLDFEGNMLSALPDFHNFRLLERLSVTKNRLSQLPASIGGCCHMVSLYADHNRIQQIQFTFESLTQV